AEDLDSLAAATPPRSPTVRLLPGFDQWVLGPGTGDPHILVPFRRRLVSRQSGWIAPVVVADGVVSGTWELGANGVRLNWFAEAGRPPADSLQRELDRLSVILDRGLNLEIVVA
ncbi:MAG: crosslink repair DNA glycosylase YcaQ family protein, partial [Candidatus Dormiibacterota bacterium]